jgi:hypothetical protein
VQHHSACSKHAVERISSLDVVDVKELRQWVGCIREPMTQLSIDVTVEPLQVALKPLQTDILIHRGPVGANTGPLNLEAVIVTNPIQYLVDLRHELFLVRG